MGRWLAAWVVACGLRGGAQTAQEPVAVPAVPSPVLTGPQLFQERGCLQCHMLHKAGGHKGPDLSAVGKRLSAEKIRVQIAEGGGAMPPYADALGDGELEKLVEFLRRTKK